MRRKPPVTGFSGEDMRATNFMMMTIYPTSDGSGKSYFPIQEIILMRESRRCLRLSLRDHVLSD